MADTLFRLAFLLPCRTQILLPVGDFRPPTIFNPTCFSSPYATSAPAAVFQHRQRSSYFVVHAVVAENEEPKWWSRSAGPNMIDIHSTKEFLEALSQSGDKLVVVEFYGTWCGSCRALFPKLCKTAEEHPDILFLKVDFDKNKPMCKRLNVRVLPFFHFYRGAEGRLESFSCSLAKADLEFVFDGYEECFILWASWNLLPPACSGRYLTLINRGPVFNSGSYSAELPVRLNRLLLTDKTDTIDGYFRYDGYSSY